MKIPQVILTAVVTVLVATTTLYAQPQVRTIPAIKIKNMKGEVVSTASLNNDGKPMVINFWATWCKPCVSELASINTYYDEWQKETGVKLVAISIDDARNSHKVAPYVNGKNWSFEVYIDENSDLRRALNVINPPHTFLVNGNGEIVYQHVGYQPGDEEHLLAEIKKLVASDKIKSDKSDQK